MGLVNVYKTLKSIIRSHHAVVVLETVEEDRVREMVHRLGRELALPVFEWSITQGLHSTDIAVLASDNTEKPEDCLRYIEEFKPEGLFLLKDFTQHLNTPNIIRAMRETAQKMSLNRSTIILVAPSIQMPQELAHKTMFIPWSLPDREELKVALKNVIENLSQHQSIQIALAPEDFSHLLDSLTGLTLKQVREVIMFSVVEDRKLARDDIAKVVERKRLIMKDGGVLDFYPANQTASFHIGGFDRLKSWLTKMKTAFSSEARGLGLPPPKGMLLVGIPGCGKSLAAKAVARSWQLPLLKLDAGRLYDRYVGESEKNFRRAVETAEAMAPCVFWIDEIEKAMGGSGASNADGGLSQRIFGSFLTWMQERKSDVFVVATANNISALPSELLRKGRFDEIFFVDLPDEQERLEILRIHLNLKKQDSSRFDLLLLAQATEGFSGAEIEQTIVSSLLRSLRDKTSYTSQLILEEVQETVPLSRSQPENIAQLRALAKDRFVPVK